MPGTADRTVGIIVMPEFVQTEGIEAVLDNLAERAGVTAVSTSPYVMEPAPEGAGSREPPIDAGAGGVRLLDRPLWGRRELSVLTAPSFVRDLGLYEGLRYQPPDPDELTAREGETVQRFIRAAKARGLKTYFQIMAATPPGYRVQFANVADDDQPRLPDGRIPAERVDKNGSLASPHIRAYSQAMVRDLCRAYPDIDGFRIDWPEYPPYLLDGMFADFSDHAAAAAARHAIDFEAMRADTLALYGKLHGGLTAADLEAWSAPDGWDTLLSDYPGVADLLKLKAILSCELVQCFREALDQETGPGGKELLPNAFPPPWNHLSGLDFARIAPYCDGFGVKLYTMHWEMMLRFYGEALLRANPGLPDDILARALEGWSGAENVPPARRVADFAYPEPDEPHPAGTNAQARKIMAAREAAGDTPVYALAHGYGPVEDVRRRIKLAWESSGRRLWVNRYGYLADDKLDLIGEITRG